MHVWDNLKLNYCQCKLLELIFQKRIARLDVFYWNPKLCENNCNCEFNIYLETVMKHQNTAQLKFECRVTVASFDWHAQNFTDKFN